MTASESSPGKGQECDGASQSEQSVLRELVDTNTQLVADELRLRNDDLAEQLKTVRRAQAELSVLETLLLEYVDEEEVEE